MRELIINGTRIGRDTSPYLIAEISANHNGSIETAKASITAAKRAGASAVKIQSYTADTMTIDSDRDDFLITQGLWKGKTLYQLYQEACTPFEWHEELFTHAREEGITLFSSPFDETAVDLLDSLGAPAYKIASFELIDLPLISYVAKKHKPMLMSTGMASKDEIRQAVKTAVESGCEQIGLFHCISGYPTPLDEANLNNIRSLREEFELPIGLSDHTLGNTAAIVATSLGATFFEKHFTLDRNEPGPDSAFSIEPSELELLKRDIQNAYNSLGKEIVDRPESESANRTFRRSLYFVQNVKKGDKITEEHVRRIRPGHGLAPMYYDQVIGKTATKDLARGQRVCWDCLED